MSHPFEQRHNVLWLAAAVAILIGYFFLAVPSGDVRVVKPSALTGSVLPTQSDASALAVAAVAAKPSTSVPLEGMIVAMTIGVIALIASIGSLETSAVRGRRVSWVGPRSR
ncbi:MAG: hypothetical protein U0172_14305 [Nitrospiraceae bacterium]